MKAFMTPVLPGSMPELDDVGDLTKTAEHQPLPPQEPGPSLPFDAEENMSFRDALFALLQAHETEISALQKEVEELQRKRNGVGEKHISSCLDAGQDQTKVTQFNDNATSKDEPPATGTNCNFSKANGDHLPAANTVRFASEIEKDRKSSESKPAVGMNGKSSVATTATKHSVFCDEEFIPRRTTLRTTMTTLNFECNYTLGELKLVERRWIKIVSDRYMLAQQHTNQLHEKWCMSDKDLRKVAESNDSVDVWASAETKRKKVRRGQAARLSSFAVSSNSPLGSLRFSNAIRQTGRVKEVLKTRLHFMRYYGLLAYLEKYVVMLPHSSSQLIWVALGMLLMLYDAVVVPLQPFNLDESQGILYFLKWFQAVFWLCDIVVTFFTAIYVDVELNRNLKVIARKYATSWLLFDVCILLPVWIEQLSLDQSGVADVKALKVIRILRFFRLVRLAKITFLLDEQLKAVNNPSLILIFKLLRLILGLVIFMHVNGCIWYSVGKQQDGWTVALDDTDLLYKYLTSVHWTVTQFSGTSEMAPGKFSAERGYALCTVIMSIMIFATFLSNFTNIIMQLQSLTVERDHQIRDLCIYMRGHQIPRQLSMKVRNYLSWKSDTDKSRGCDALKILPERLVMEVEFEVCSPTISQHEFFCEFLQVYPRLSRRVLHACLHPIYMSPEDLVFSAQESSNYVYFTVSGLLDYAVILRRANEALTLGREAVGPGVTLSEPTLWMQWQHRGTLMSVGYCHLLALNADEWRTMVLTHPPAHVSCNLYARRLIAGMARNYWRCTDVIVPAHLISGDDSNFLDTIMEATMQKLLTAGNNLATRLAMVNDEEDDDE